MGNYIIQSDVMGRLLSLTSLDVASGVLDGVSFIPTAEAVFGEECSVAYADMTDNQQTIAKAAMIAHCAATVVTSAPTEKIEGVNASISPISAKDKEIMLNILLNEYARLLSRISGRSWVNGSITVDHTGRTTKSGWAL